MVSSEQGIPAVAHRSEVWPNARVAAKVSPLGGLHMVMMTARAVLIRPLDANVWAETEVVAERMHQTLAEVLDEDRASAMFSGDELIARVRWHLDAVPGREAEVFVAQDGDSIVGHTMVRVESEGSDTYGLFATTFVAPGARRAGTASALLDEGERWMRERGMTLAVTFTDPGNTKLLELYEKFGYRTEVLSADWARASKVLSEDGTV